MDKTVKHRRHGGFTLVELVMGMLISGIILSAVATLSFAVRQGQEVTDQIADSQSVLRSVSVIVPDLIRNASSVLKNGDGNLEVEEASGTTTYLNITGDLNIEMVKDGSTLPLVEGCTSAEFNMNDRLVVLLFTLDEETGSRDYQVCATVRSDPNGLY